MKSVAYDIAAPGSVRLWTCPKVKSKLLLVIFVGSAAVLTLANFSLLGTILGPESFGRFQTYLLVLQLMAPLTLSGMMTATAQSVARGFEGSYRRNAFTSLSVFAALFTVFIIIVFAANGFNLVDTWVSKPFGIAFPIVLSVGVFTVPIWVFRHWTALFVGRGRFIHAAFAQNVSAAIFLSFLIIGYFTELQLSLSTWVLVYLSSYSVANILYTLFYRAKNRKIEVGGTKFGVMATLTTIPNLVANHVDKLILIASQSFVDVGVLAILEKITDIIKQLIQKITAIKLPQYATDQAEFRFNKTNIMILGVAGMALCVLSLCFYLFANLFFSEFNITLFQTFLPVSLAFMIPANYQYTYIKSRFDWPALMKVQLTASLVRVALSLSIVPFWGVDGAVASAFFYRLAVLAITTKVRVGMTNGH